MEEEELVWKLEVEDDTNDDAVVDDVVERWGLIDDVPDPILWVIRPGSSDFFLDLVMMKTMIEIEVKLMKIRQSNDNKLNWISEFE